MLPNIIQILPHASHMTTRSSPPQDRNGKVVRGRHAYLHHPPCPRQHQRRSPPHLTSTLHFLLFSFLYFTLSPAYLRLFLFLRKHTQDQKYPPHPYPYPYPAAEINQESMWRKLSPSFYFQREDVKRGRQLHTFEGGPKIHYIGR